MLVLSRRPDQEVHFPNIGVTLKVLTVRGRVAKLGISAPDDVEIVRPESKGASKSREPVRQTPSDVDRHDLKNRLNNVKLAAAVFERQRELGLDEAADATFDRLVNLLTGPGAAAPAISSSGGKETGSWRAVAQAPTGGEDDANERELLSGLLKLYGFEVTTCADGNEALAVLARGPRPDLVLLDMRMPNCNGQELVDRIRGTQELADLTLFAVSATDPGDFGIEKGLQGVNQWFPKPLDPSRLLNVLRNQPTAVASKP